MIKIFKFFRLFAMALVLIPYTNFIKGDLSKLATDNYYFRVAPTGTDMASCGSEAQPCRTIQYAVNMASSGATILVAGGTYVYSGGTSDGGCSKSTITTPVICIVNKHLNVLGGYSLDNWSVSEPEVNISIIDGQAQHRGITVLGLDMSHAIASLDLEGFTIQNGLAQGAASGSDFDIGAFGGGIFSDTASFILRNIIFKNNRSIGGNVNGYSGGVGVGAGMEINKTPLDGLGVMERVTFENNNAYGGTGINRGGDSLGGGFHSWGARLNIKYLTMKNNSANGGSPTGQSSDNTGGDGIGGGCAIHGTNDIPNQAVLQYVTATGNHAVGGNAMIHGGGGHGAAIENESASAVTVFDATIKDNWAIGGNGQNGGTGSGGAILSENSGLDLERSALIANVARGGDGSVERGPAGGGAIFGKRTAGGTTLTLSSVVIADNLAMIGLGSGTASGGGGGGLYLEGVQVNIVYGTFAGNRLDSELVYGSAIIMPDSSMRPTPSTVTLSCSLITDHQNHFHNSWPVQDAIHVWAGNTLTIQGSLFANNVNDIYKSGDSKDPPSPGGPGAIFGYPESIFTTSAGYIFAGSPYYNYHLKLSSVAIDKATCSGNLDLDGQPRPYNGRADIGADEYVPFPVMARSGDQQIFLDWSRADQTLAGGVSKYSILVSCPSGANPPNELPCGQSTDIGSNPAYHLTKLSNFKKYSIVVSAKSSDGTVIATSITVDAAPTDIFIYLPLLFK